jgi:hypothetical protein
MEMDDNNNPVETGGDYIEIYSRKAIFWFAVFSPLYASILLMINLWVAGFKSAIYQVVIFIFGWAFLTYIVENKLAQLLHINNILTSDPKLFSKVLYVDLASLALNIVCGGILAGFFFKKYFPDNDYYPRSVQTPLVIFICFILFSLFALGRSL